ncbi:CinA family protein [Celeribacter halophilus]|uniref:CinA family protein n=1 Tax=Celeribacter halophilus TaxID=576117 RepID=UPI0026E2DD87|nr:nicotinamide-nucleotide amidohydrolase family protein [Celeribacter halophilus]MDO6511195.1 nicotinamide-nucleotide amidohydrolase family protein [Celeribacter halophilus]
MSTAIPYDLAEATLAAARAKGILIATAESCTGGMIIGSLTEVAGSSDVVDRGFITYSNAAKHEMLGVSPATLTEFGAVSEQVAREMAEGALARSAAGVAVSVTGIAGPGGSEHKPEGRVCFGLALTGRETTVKTCDFGALGRDKVRSVTITTALEMIQDAIAGL